MSAQKVTAPQAAALWLKAGGDARYAVPMALIAIRESNGDPTVENLKFPDHSIGLWQINQLAHHGRYGSDAELKDPLTNARAAVALFNASKHAGLDPLKPWSTHNPAIDNKYIGLVGKSAADVLGTTQATLDDLQDKLDSVGKASPLGAPFRAFADVAEALAAFFNLLTDPKTWLRALMLVGGLVIGFFALKQLAVANGAAA